MKAKDLKEIGRSVLQAEADAIVTVSKLLDQDFERAVELCDQLAPEGRIVTTGMGKVGYVAMKLSATLASVGVPSFFLHPAEAIHGDFGRFTRADVVVIFSNTGETSETLRLIPLLKKIGSPVIGITAKRESTLGSRSDVTLCIGEHQEAGPLGLAPTSSTTAMLALGDALAMAVLSNKEFTREHFAQYHPGGGLGLKLTPVTEIMRTRESHCIVPDSMIARDVLNEMMRTKKRAGSATIVNSAGLLVGIFTDGDLRRSLSRDISFLDRPIAEVMGKAPRSISSDKLVEDALKMIAEHQLDEIIVVDRDNRPIGLVDVQDIVRL